MIAPLERVTAVAVEVEARAPRDEDPLSAPACVVQPFQEPAPRAVLVDLVEDPEFGDWKLASQNSLAMLRDVPAQLAGLCAGQRSRERRLAHLSGAADEDHSLFQVVID